MTPMNNSQMPVLSNKCELTATWPQKKPSIIRPRPILQLKQDQCSLQMDQWVGGGGEGETTAGAGPVCGGSNCEAQVEKAAMP